MTSKLRAQAKFAGGD